MELSLQSQEGGVTRVGVHGEVAYDDLSGRDDPLSELLGSDCYKGKVLLDLKDVDTLDSTGISWLLACRKYFHNGVGKFVLHSPSDFASEVLKILNLSLVIPIAANEQAAIEIINKDD